MEENSRCSVTEVPELDRTVALLGEDLRRYIDCILNRIQLHRDPEIPKYVVESIP